MKAIILAAGVGKRMGEISKSIPKCLIEVGNKTIVEYQIEALKSNDINDISIVLGYQADKVKNVLKGMGIKFYLNENFENTGMLESLYCAKNELNNDFILLYGDLVLRADLIKKLLEDKSDFCLVVDRDKKIMTEAEDTFEEYHGEKMSKGSTKVKIVNGIVTKIAKNLNTDEASAEHISMSKFSKRGTEKIYNKISELVKNREIKKYPSPSYLFRWLIEQGNDIRVVYTNDLIYEEIDYPEDLEKAKKKFG